MKLLRRKPDVVIGGNYLHRWHIIPRNKYANVYFHRFFASDSPVPHDHPWFNISIVLKGQYREHFHDGTSRLRRPGSVVFRGARSLHWLEIVGLQPVETLFLTGPIRRVWGFMTRSGWVDFRTYLSAHEKERHGLL